MTKSMQNVLLTVLAVVLVAAFAATGIANAATAATCGSAKPTSMFSGFQAFAGDPAAYATPAGCATPIDLIRVLDAAAVVALILLAIGAAVAWRRWSQSDAHFIQEMKRRRGFAEAGEVRKHLSGKALTKRANVLRPTLTGKVAPEQVGWKVGASRGIDTYVSIEDSVIVLGPPRSGKGLRFIINAILDWSGPLVTTSTRNDNLAATMAARQRMGEVTVFDPQQLSGVRSPLKVSPVIGCEDPLTAEQRAAALVGASSMGQSSTNQEWAGAAAGILARLLHAAAIGGRGVTDLALWGDNPSLATDAVDILDTDGPAGWGAGLAAVIHGDERLLGSQWFGVRETLAPLRIPQIADAMNPTRGEEFDPAAFLTGPNTLYLIGTGRGAGAAGAFLAALMDDVVEQARRKALTSQDSRLDPPLGLILDEIANIFAWPALPTVMADGGGIGISPLVVLQARTQAETQWSRAEMESVFSAATAKLMLGGSTDIGFLKDLEALLGTREILRRSHSYSDDSSSQQYSREQRPLVSVDELRRFPHQLGLLSYRARRPILLDLQAWGDRADADTIRQGKKATESAQQEVFALQAAERAERYRRQ